MAQHSRAFEIFATAPPGLELTLKSEIQSLGFPKPKAIPGGVRFRGKWADVWRANLHLRGAGRVLARVAKFQAMHLSQLEAKTAEISWSSLLPPGAAVVVEASCHKSKIYHQGAAAERAARAICAAIGGAEGGDDAIRVQLRIDDNQCVFSLDSSGELLHKRGHKQAVGKAPIRETLAALFLRACRYDGGEPVLDPMCGSGTFVTEAAEIAQGLPPGRARTFAFEKLVTFEPQEWADMQTNAPRKTDLSFYGSDRDAGAIEAATANAERAGLGEFCHFTHSPLSALQRPGGPPGLVMINPPYGARIGDKKQLYGLYASLGRVLSERFGGWRVGIVTTDAVLIRAADLPFGEPGPPVAHGGLTVRLWQTGALP